ncbi:MAG TPA: hypothetical protein EYF95_00825 [Flavobacteriales bacterium]|jgi:hypothetical protein|nr:hypothetical protein [Flavobacteriales bacterium]
MSENQLFVKGSVEDTLEQIYQRLEKEYEYADKAKHLNTLQEVMVTLSAEGWPNIKKWYHGE